MHLTMMVELNHFPGISIRLTTHFPGLSVCLLGCASFSDRLPRRMDVDEEMVLCFSQVD